jgi:16S rRNA (adenine(1408)-N(1))-methyltransferase
VLAAAQVEPDRLVIGVDANAAAMAGASWRAGRKPERGGVSNVLFVVAAAEQLPDELDSVAELVTVHLPWGSLLRGLLRPDPLVMTGLAGLMSPGARLSMLVSSTVRDQGAGVEPIEEATLQRLASGYRRQGLAVTKLRPATTTDVVAAHSTWGKRLGVGRQRPAWLLEAKRSNG